jgi:hypothetical protein
MIERMGMALVVVLAGCAGSRSTREPAAAPAVEPSSDPPAAPAAAPSDPPPGATATGPEVTPSHEVSTVTAPTTGEVITGIPSCDAYLELYARCEDHLRPEIMAGDRRFYAAEKASLLFLVDSPEGPGLPKACTAMLDALVVDCPVAKRAAPVASGG